MGNARLPVAGMDYPVPKPRNEGGAESEMQMEFTKELDARGLNCPLPILKTKKSLDGMAAGEILKVVSTDAGSVKDMQAFAKQTGNELVGSQESGKEYVFFLRKK